MKLRTLAYVNAAVIAGVGTPRIIWRHILPNVRHLTIIYFTLNFGVAVMLEVLVGYLGLGGSTSVPGWGSMIAAGRVISILDPDSAPIKRVVQEARDRGMLIDASYGRKTKAVILMDTDHVILSAMTPEVLAARWQEPSEEEKE
jgi:regulator of extracellular matrix RemA (YlzA/DUF370 family)